MPNFFGDASGQSEVLYGLVTTATVMTIIEIMAAFQLVFPETKRAIDKGIASIPEKRPRFELARLGLLEARQVIATARSREEQSYKNTINRHSYFFAGGLIVLLVLLTFALRKNYLMHQAQNGTSRISNPVKAAGLTVVSLLPFQVLFYFMSKNFWLFQDPFPMFAPIVYESCSGVTPESLELAKAKVAFLAAKDAAKADALTDLDRLVGTQARRILLEGKDLKGALANVVSEITNAAISELDATKVDVRDLVADLRPRPQLQSGGPTMASLRIR